LISSPTTLAHMRGTSHRHVSKNLNAHNILKSVWDWAIVGEENQQGHEGIFFTRP